MEDNLQAVVNQIALQGGSLNPDNYYLYHDNKIQYLCYNAEYYQPCVVQQPLLKQHIEEEINNGIKESSDNCFQSLKDSFEGRGFDVSFVAGETTVNLLPNAIKVEYAKDLVLTKGSTERYKTLNVIVNNNLYELISIANSIVSSEVRYGDAETTIYMNYYHNLKVGKNKQSDGTTIYSLTNRDTNDQFQFASRSIAWPPGIIA